MNETYLLEYKHHVLNVGSGELGHQVLELSGDALEEILHRSDLAVELHEGLQDASHRVGLNLLREVEHLLHVTEPGIKLLQTFLVLLRKDELFKVLEYISSYSDL